MLPIISDLKPRTLLLLAGFNAAISLISLTYDIPALRTIPLWAMPFVVICPIYPFLLAFVWLRIAQKKLIHHFLIAFAILPAAVYGLASLVYYPLVIQQTYPNWRDIGQILWVWLYAGQAWYLIRRWPIPPLHACLALIFVVVSASIQFITLGYGYLDYASLTLNQRIFLLVFVCVSSLSVYQIWLFRRPLTPPVPGSRPKRGL